MAESLSLTTSSSCPFLRRPHTNHLQLGKYPRATAPVHWPGHVQHGLHDVIASHRAALIEDSLVFLSESTANIHVGCQRSPRFIHSPGSGPTLTARNSAESSWVQEGGCYRPTGAHTLLTSLGKGDASSASGAQPVSKREFWGSYLWRENICPGYLDCLTFVLWSLEDGEHLWHPAFSHPGAKVLVSIQVQRVRKEAGWFCRACNLGKSSNGRTAMHPPSEHHG